MRSLDVHQDIVNAVAFSADGALLATGSGDRSARLWDTGTGEMVVAIAGAPSFSEVSASRFSPDALRIASASESLVVIWDVLKGNELARLSGHTEKVSVLGVRPWRQSARYRIRQISKTLVGEQTRRHRAICRTSSIRSPR